MRMLEPGFVVQVSYFFPHYHPSAGEASEVYLYFFSFLFQLHFAVNTVLFQFQVRQLYTLECDFFYSIFFFDRMLSATYYFQ